MVSSVATAGTGVATLTIHGNSLGVVTITLASPGFVPANTPLTASTAALGTISKNGVAPTGWTNGTITGGWKLTTPVTVTTTETLTGTTQAALTAKLDALQANVTYKVDAVSLTTSDQLIAVEPYGSHLHDVILEIGNSASSGLFTHVVTFTVTAQ
jgi:hypothetical protein